MQKVIALGFFDGVHLGHGAILRRTSEFAEKTGAAPAVLTFDRSPCKDGKLLTSVSDRKGLIRRLYGIEDVIALPFDEALRQTPWDAFLDDLCKTQDAAGFVCGWDYRFGSGAMGTTDCLQAYCKERGLGCEIVGRTELDGITVSSTYLRELISQGETERAIDFYGHPHTLTGEVVSGRQIGRQMGVPTANVFYEDSVLLPQNGVYAVKAVVDGVRYRGVCNVGSRPTVDGKQVVVEVWLPGQNLDLYGRQLRVEFYKKLRDERKFFSLQELAREIMKNALQAEAYFSE